MSKDDTFWALIARLDWSQAGDDDAVVEPVVSALAALPDAAIVEFEETLARTLYALDGRAWARESGSIWNGEPDRIDEDAFLYARCAVVANGRESYEAVLATPSLMPKDLEFESLLYMAGTAFERRTHQPLDTETAVSWETFSNDEGWA
jgi:hypothetical protein